MIPLSLPQPLVDPVHAFQQMPSASLTYYAINIAIVVVFGAPTAILLGRWACDRRRRVSLAGAISLGVLSLLAVNYLRIGVERDLARLKVAQELGVDYRTVSDPNSFPANYLRHEIVPDVTTRNQVHAIMRVARARYKCGPYAEKYLLLSSQYSDPDAHVVNVYYHLNDTDIAYEAQGPVDSGDNPPISDCTPF